MNAAFRRGELAGYPAGKAIGNEASPGEEWKRSVDAFCAHCPELKLIDQEAWTAGYRQGFRLGARGEVLTAEATTPEVKLETTPRVGLELGPVETMLQAFIETS